MLLLPYCSLNGYRVSAAVLNSILPGMRPSFSIALKVWLSYLQCRSGILICSYRNMHESDSRAALDTFFNLSVLLRAEICLVVCIWKYLTSFFLGSFTQILKGLLSQRGVYSNVHGFLGGINVAIMLTYIVKKWRIPAASVLVQQFLKVYLRRSLSITPFCCI